MQTFPFIKKDKYEKDIYVARFVCNDGGGVTSAQDRIYLKDNNLIEAEILSINDASITYFRWGEKGHIYSIGMDKVLRVESMTTPSPANTALNNSQSDTELAVAKENNNYTTYTIEKAVTTEPKAENTQVAQKENENLPLFDDTKVYEGSMCEVMKQLIKDVDKSNNTKQQKITILSNRLAKNYQEVVNTRDRAEVLNKYAEFKDCMAVYNTYFVQQFGKNSTYADQLHNDLIQKKGISR